MTFGLAFGLAGGLVMGLVIGLVMGLVIGLVMGLAGGLAFGLGSAVQMAMVEAIWGLRFKRVRFIPLLQTALHKQVLRQAGAVYQFRHAALQDLLAVHDISTESSNDRPRAQGATMGDVGAFTMPPGGAVLVERDDEPPCT